MKSRIFRNLFSRIFILLIGFLFLASMIPGKSIFAQENSSTPSIELGVLSQTEELISALRATNGDCSTPYTIDLAPGTYTLTAIESGLNGLPVINCDVTINGNNASIVKDAAAPSFRIFEISSTGSLTLNEVTVSGGSSPEYGGGIYIDNGALYLIGSTISNNIASWSGNGIYNNGGYLSIQDSTIQGNSTTEYVPVPYGFGGGVYSLNGSVVILNSTISNNDAYRGGSGIYVEGGSLSVNQSVFTANGLNDGGPNGGAIYGSSTNAEIFDSTFTENDATIGTAILAYYGTWNIQGSTFENNVNHWSGSPSTGSYTHAVLSRTNLTFSNNVISRNIGGGLFVDYGSAIIKNNCIIGNIPDSDGFVVKGNITFNAINHYWGAADGPSGAGSGSGDPVNANVNFTPFLTTLPAWCPDVIAITGINITPTPAYPKPATENYYYEAPSKEILLTSTVFGTGDFDPSVTWSIESGGGSLSTTSGETTIFTTPASEEITSTIRATSAADPSIYKDITIETKELTIKCYRIRASVPPGGSVPFSCSDSFGGKNWDVISGEGTIDFQPLPGYNGLFATYTAGQTVGDATVRVSAVADPNIYFDIPVSVNNSGAYTCSNSITVVTNSTGGTTYYVSTGGLQENYPYMYSVSVDNHDPLIGEFQTFTVNARVKDPATEPITTLSVTSKLDNGMSSIIPLTLVSGTTTDGTWEGGYQVTDTHCYAYYWVLEVTNNIHTTKIIVAVDDAETIPQIDVQGNGQSIADGDTVPEITDNTDFGNAGVGVEIISHTFIIKNSGAAVLNLSGNPKVEITGPHAEDFTVTSLPISPVAANGGTTSFEITFDPSAGGLREAEVSILNDDYNKYLYNFSIQGTGIPAPNNDDFNFAKDIATLSYTDEINTQGATSDPTDPVLPEQCGVSLSGAATVWYTYTPSSDWAISVNTEGADYDTFIAVWEGTDINNLKFVACNDDTGGTKQSAVAIRVTGNKTYYIEIGHP